MLFLVFMFFAIVFQLLIVVFYGIEVVKRKSEMERQDAAAFFVQAFVTWAVMCNAFAWIVKTL